MAKLYEVFTKAGHAVSCFFLPIYKEFFHLRQIDRAYKNGTIITVCSQCSQGAVSLGTYAASSALRRVGAVNGRDMTTEAALAKSYYLLSISDDMAFVKAQMQKSLRGELTE